MSMESVLRDVIMDKVAPVGDRVVLERDSQEEKTAGGILLPESSRDLPVTCTVVAVGEGEYKDGQLIPIKLKKGERVVVSQYAGTRFKVSDKSYLVVKYSDVLFKI